LAPPVNLGPHRCSIGKPDSRNALLLAPAADTAALPQHRQLADTAAFGDGLDTGDFADDAEIPTMLKSTRESYSSSSARMRLRTRAPGRVSGDRPDIGRDVLPISRMLSANRATKMWHKQ